MTITAFDTANNNLLVVILTLIDTALLAGLYIVIRDYENFVVELGIDDHEDRFVYIGKVGFSGLKIKLISTVIAISALVLLKLYWPENINKHRIGLESLRSLNFCSFRITLIYY